MFLILSFPVTIRRSGFIGSSLTKKLVEEGWQVDVVDDMSGGSIEALGNLKLRTLPNGSFLGPFYDAINRKEGQPITSPSVHTERKQDTVLVIPDNFASDHVLSHVHQGY